MATFKIIDTDTGNVVATDSGASLAMIKKYKLAYASQQHLQLVQTN